MKKHPLWALLLAATLPGCALNFAMRADEGEVSSETATVITGRINYVIDGRPMTPYGAFTPAWPAPPAMAISMTTGDPHVFPQVRNEDGSFRWRAAPGAYVISSIGMGTYTDDRRIYWPRVVMCVPRAAGGTVYLGHLRLEGTRYEEEVKLSSGTQYTARGIRYRFEVVDEEPARPPQSKRLMRSSPDIPSGDTLATRWRADARALERELCGELLR